MFFSNLVMYFIILTAGVVLFPHGVHKIDKVEQAATALKPVAGQLAYYLFAAGVIGTGLLTIPVLCGSLSYIYSETFGWRGDLDKPLRQAKAFYGVITISLLLGLAINYIGISPIDALLYTAILYGITAPVMIAVVIRIANNKKVMKEFINTRRSNIMGWVTFSVMTIAALFLIYNWIS
jgi:Mn2+/Fe2+ NRAMP family transporter